MHLIILQSHDDNGNNRKLKNSMENKEHPNQNPENTDKVQEENSNAPVQEEQSKKGLAKQKTEDKAGKTKKSSGKATKVEKKTKAPKKEKLIPKEAEKQDLTEKPEKPTEQTAEKPVEEIPQTDKSEADKSPSELVKTETDTVAPVEEEKEEATSEKSKDESMAVGAGVGKKEEKQDLTEKPEKRTEQTAEKPVAEIPQTDKSEPDKSPSELVKAETDTVAPVEEEKEEATSEKSKDESMAVGAGVGKKEEKQDLTEKVEKPTEETSEAPAGEIPQTDDSPSEKVKVEPDTVAPVEEKTEEVLTEKGEGETMAVGAEAGKKKEKREESKIDEKDQPQDEGQDDDVEPKKEEDYNDLSREELVTLLETAISEEDINDIKKKVALIKVSYLKKTKKESTQDDSEATAKEGDEEKEVKAEEDDLDNRFNDIFSVYRDKRQKYLEDQEVLKKENLEKKKIILEELKTLIDSEETLKKTYDEFRELQEKWKLIGMVPKNEVNNLWQNYHFYVEKFFDKVKINKELRDLDLKKNLEAKIELCEKTEELIIETSVINSFKRLQKYHEEWKEIGPVPQDKKDELWERFKSATEQINARRREHYAKIHEDQKINYVAKTALCENTEDILAFKNETVKDWQENTYKISELLKVWKTIGPAPKKQNDEIWERFKTSLDVFFSGKKEYFGKLKDQQLNNYNLKLELCLQAEAIQSSTDWRKTTQEFLNLQKDWKQIGPVPRKHSDKVWKRFRAACDEFFNKKSEFFQNIGQHESENLKAKEELIKKVEAHQFSNDKSENLGALKEFQRMWTDIGHVPIKEKDRIQNEFRSAINNQMDKLKIDKAEIQALSYMHRIESFKDDPNASRMIRSEKNFLSTKKKKLEEDIKVWENNLGFLAESKKAALLKEEFEKKIDKAKNDIEVMNAKLKLLDD